MRANTPQMTSCYDDLYITHFSDIYTHSYIHRVPHHTHHIHTSLKTQTQVRAPFQILAGAADRRRRPRERDRERRRYVVEIV